MTLQEFIHPCSIPFLSIYIYPYVIIVSIRYVPIYICVYIYIILSHYYLQHNTRSCYMFIVHVFSYIHIISIASILPYNFPYHPFHIYLIIHYIYTYALYPYPYSTYPPWILATVYPIISTVSIFPYNCPCHPFQLLPHRYIHMFISIGWFCGIVWIASPVVWIIYHNVIP